MTHTAKKTTLVAVALAGLVVATNPAPAAACYASPEDMVEMTARSHFWSLVEDAAPADHRVVVRHIVIDKKKATALVGVVANGVSSYFKVTLTGERWNWRFEDKRVATSEEALAMAMMERVETLSLMLYQARASRALATR